VLLRLLMAIVVLQFSLGFRLLEYVRLVSMLGRHVVAHGVLDCVVVHDHPVARAHIADEEHARRACPRVDDTSRAYRCFSPSYQVIHAADVRTLFIAVAAQQRNIDAAKDLEDLLKL